MRGCRLAMRLCCVGPARWTLDGDGGSRIGTEIERLVLVCVRRWSFRKGQDPSIVPDRSPLFWLGGFPYYNRLQEKKSRAP